MTSYLKVISMTANEFLRTMKAKGNNDVSLRFGFGTLPRQL
ncbi:hypothetical protein ACI8B_180111 [Acinetobacter proteolyticus]|uniref:Uncharacterized protein n=1 Tax=Acinetobacter proteolyticus TaxID=1776741 RepID=A0A653K322_9GAMM|nr:hypothetical protein ACI8B_180111 [Acinetobacter proteolyticus]